MGRLPNRNSLRNTLTIHSAQCIQALVHCIVVQGEEPMAEAILLLLAFDGGSGASVGRMFALLSTELWLTAFSGQHLARDQPWWRHSQRAIRSYSCLEQRYGWILCFWGFQWKLCPRWYLREFYELEA